MNIDEALARVPIFGTLEPEEMLAVKKILEKKILSENAIVFQEKEPGDGLYVIAIGAVRIVKYIDESNCKTLASLTDGDFFGEMALLDGKPRSAAAVTTRSSVIFKISVTSFNQLMETTPFAALKVISQIACVMAVRMRDINLRLAELENRILLKS